MKEFFDNQGVDFDQHILNSIPGYDLLINQTKALTESFASYSRCVLDVGCSSGKFLESLDVQCPKMGIDFSDLVPWDGTNDIHYVKKDFFEVNLAEEHFSVITSIFFLQFLDKFRRVEALKKMYDALAPGGKLIVAEKVYFDDPAIQRTIDAWHRQYKKQAFTYAEILDKDAFVARDMPIQTKRGLQAEFKEAGFSDWELFFSCSGFQGWVLTK